MNIYRESVRSLLIAVCPDNLSINTRKEWCIKLESQLFTEYSLIDYRSNVKLLVNRIKKYQTFLEGINEERLCRLNVTQLSKILCK